MVGTVIAGFIATKVAQAPSSEFESESETLYYALPPRESEPSDRNPMASDQLNRGLGGTGYGLISLK